MAVAYSLRGRKDTAGPRARRGARRTRVAPVAGALEGALDAGCGRGKLETQRGRHGAIRIARRIAVRIAVRGMDDGKGSYR